MQFFMTDFSLNTAIALYTYHVDYGNYRLIVNYNG